MAQRKITSAKVADDELPELTVQQSKFVEGLLSGKTASDAYRAAYDCSNSKPTTIWVEASKLRNHTNVALWLSVARKAELGHAKVTLDQHVKRLDRLQELCVSSGNLGAAVQAEQLIGKAMGHYTEKLQVSVTDPLDTLKEIEKISPELARQLAAEEGISWETKH